MENCKKSIAVVGVSADQTKYGYKIFSDLVLAGYNVAGINPKGGEILNKKIYRNLKELGFIPDFVITVVKPSVTEKIVEQCRELGIKEIWMQPGSESDKAIENAEKYGTKVIHHACYMVVQKIW